MNKFGVFISYSRDDVEQARQLQAKLTAAGHDVFRDEDRLQSGEHIDQALPEALRNSGVVIVIWSENSAKSGWVYDEAAYAKGAGKYLPHVVDGFNHALIPERLRDYNAPPLTSALDDLDGLIARINKLRNRPHVEVFNRMPESGGRYLVGREQELKLLNDAWASDESRVVVLDAMGGTGKTALINRFLEDMANDGWRGADRVFCWSFYSQGTDETRQGDADGFFQEALEWFGHQGEEITSADRRGRRLADLINTRKTLFVLDGLEPLQFPDAKTGLRGELKDKGLTALFKQLSLGMNGLMIITTRLPVPLLAEKRAPTVQPCPLDRLTPDAGVTLLGMYGVGGTQDRMRETVDLVGGHALSLNLLATYAADMLDGQLPVRSEVEEWLGSQALAEETPEGRQALVMMRRYEILLEDEAAGRSRKAEATAAGKQLALLYFIGLFDRPAERDAIEVLLSDPIAGVTDTLGELSGREWDLAVSALRKFKLLLPADPNTPGELDAHPLVREYFGRRLKETRPEAFKAANLRLYEHYKLKDIPKDFHDPLRYGVLALRARFSDDPENYNIWSGGLEEGRFPEELYHELPPVLRGIAPETLGAVLDDLDGDALGAALEAAQPDTVKDMEPLFAAIAHGAAAEAEDAAYREVYFARVMRGNEAYAVTKLGAYGADLSALAHFFETPFGAPSPRLAAPTQSLILGHAAFGLRALGRLVEAEAPYEEALKRDVADAAWKNASISAGNLSEVRLAIGKVDAAVAAAVEAVDHADRSEDAFQRLSKRAQHADALHQAGRLEAAARLLAEAEAIQADWQASMPLLYSVQGYRYCDLLLSRGEPDDVVRRAEKFFDWREPGDSLLTIALDSLALGRAALTLGDMSAAARHLEHAVDGLQTAGAVDYVPRGYLARAALHRATGAFGLAAQDLNEVEDIATRSRMRLFEADTHLERARLTLAQSAPDAAKTAMSLADRARAIIDDTGYRRRIPDWHLVMAEAAILDGNTVEARQHLADTGTWIGDGWAGHQPEHDRLTALLDGGAPPKPQKRTWFQRFFG